MLTFYNEKGEGFGAQVEFTVKNAVNGERSVSGTIISNDKVLSGIDKGWKFELNGEFFTIVYAKPQDQGRNLSVSFAVKPSATIFLADTLISLARLASISSICAVPI